MDPLGQLRERLESWAWRAFLRLSPLVEKEGAVRLVEAALAQSLGRRIDELAPRGFWSGHGFTSPEVRAFFERFAPELASYLPPRTIRPESLDRLREIQHALCGRLVEDHPTTLGRCGRTLLAREWREIEAGLPRLQETLTRLAGTPAGDTVEIGCRAELEAILDEVKGSVTDPQALFEMRQASRQSLTSRLRES